MTFTSKSTQDRVNALTEANLDFDPASHTYRIGNRGIPSVTQILGTFDHGLDLIDPDVLDRKAALGTAVHEACELDDIGQLDEAALLPGVLSYLDAWRTFRRDLDVEVIVCEQPVYNHIYQYAGTLDRILKFGKYRAFLADIKSGAPRPAWHGWQTAAYTSAWAINPAHLVDGRGCVYLHPGRGTGYSLSTYTDPTDIPTFNSMATVYHALQRKGQLK